MRHLFIAVFKRERKRNLQRLGELVGVFSDTWLKCAFVSGLPDDVKGQLIAACALNEMTHLK